MTNHKLLAILVLVVQLSVGPIAETAQREPEQLIGEGRIVAFQKYDRHREKPYQNGIGTFVEEWIVRIDKWETGAKKPGYFLVTYEKVSQRALSDEEINQPKWRFIFREPIFHEADSCAGSVPVPSKDGTAHQTRPASMKDFQRTKAGKSEIIPSLKDLPCLIADEPPIATIVGSAPNSEPQSTPTTR